jgi:DNA-directed RNA polymerase subunit M/transcription elongation factor TFIIS
MKNKFYKSIAVLSIITIVMLLNSCNGVDKVHLGQGEAKKSSEVEGKNGFHTDMEEVLQYKDYKDHEATCPSCDGDYRHLYKVSGDNIDENERVILRCHECGTYWDNPKDISLNGAINVVKLQEKFKVKDYSELFENRAKGWVRDTEEIKNLMWKQMAENNELLLLTE